MNEKTRLDTLVVHAGADPDPLTGAVMTPIYQTSTYAQAAPGEHKGYDYARGSNPTRDAVQTALALLEGGAAAFCYGSGMAAVDNALNLLQSGDHVVAGDDLYGGTRRLFTRVAAHRGIEFSFVELTDLRNLESAIRPETKMVWFETPTNPMLNIIDIRKVVAIARTHGLLVAVDNTFSSPINTRPLSLGVDIVMHSMTKYLNGHSDVVMGCLVVSKDSDSWRGHEGMTLVERLRFLQNSMGGVPAPFDCFLAMRGLKTLALRMQRHNENGMALSRWLESHPMVEMTRYPGLPSHPQHEIAKSQCGGFGGMISFAVRGGLDAARTVLSNVRIFTLAESLGGVESLIEHPAIMTHASVPPEVRQEIGISDSLIRISCGIEHIEDLKQDLDQAFAKVGAVASRG